MDESEPVEVEVRGFLGWVVGVGGSGRVVGGVSLYKNNISRGYM
jgi:hypothetical protein